MYRIHFSLARVTSLAAGVFAGTCAIVKYLKAPGFASVHTYNTSAGANGRSTFNGAGLAVNGTAKLRLCFLVLGHFGIFISLAVLSLTRPPHSPGGIL